MNLHISKSIKSKKQSFIICFLLVFVNASIAQITFQKTYGGAQDDYFNSVEQTTDGGYIMVGATNSFGAGGYDVYLVKTDLNGDTLWTKTYGSTGDDYGYCVKQTTDSGYIITGWTGISGPGWKIVYLIKADASGDTLWTKTYKPGAYGGAGTSVLQTLDGGYILGCSGGGSHGAEFLIKTDVLGDTLWTRSYGIRGGSSEIQQTADSGFIVTGTGDNGTLDYYLYLLKTDINGNAVWKKTYGGNDQSGYSVRQTPDGGYIAVGFTYSTGTDAYLIKTNSLGDTLWTKAYGGDSVDMGRSIYLTTDSGYIITGLTQGFTNGDVYLIRTNALGDTLWTKSFGGINIEDGNSVRQTSDGGFIVAGSTNSFGAGNHDTYLIKTDSIGNSGCYENDNSTLLRAPPTIVSVPIDTFLLDAIVVNSYPAPVGCGGSINTYCTTVEIYELVEVNAISIFPNPALENFTINLNVEVLNSYVEIFNKLGEKIYSSKLESKQKIINCEVFSSGIYFISVKNGNEVMTKKLIVNK